ncbi:hypothetical protein IQ254_15790 [Nodosilinea sp. LEGE 07088]|uniref:hypothetical protein n=1 Tax=Nodosilinea sp. LEGE 07088 TaxID=2777968 RepID=UPI00187FD979|nr:hypothetical protein [Nodosilinea sp. LEGE 07088]MBE9138636.1 hypothetical protein [Nodosilinea sp. LEGE 07088]
MAVTFEKLWVIANREARRIGEPPNDVFLPVGLRLELPVKPWEYYCTPTNVRTFASTGCDGVHYSFLELSSSSELPVVMTVPANYENPNPNVIISENLYEFLCLGSKASYIGLEELSYENGELSLLKSVDYAEFLSNEQIELLNILSDEFLLHPWSVLEERISCLQSKYLDLLQLRDQEKYFDEMSALRREGYFQEVGSNETVLIGLYQSESESYDDCPPT